MWNHPCFLECCGELRLTTGLGADQDDAELLVAEQPGRLPPEGAVRLQLPVEDGHRLGPAVDLDGHYVTASAGTDDQQEVWHDLQLRDAELLPDLPVRQGTLKLQAVQPGDGDPGLDDGKVVLVAATGHSPTGNSLVDKPGLPRRTDSVDVLHPLCWRQDCKEAGVEQPPEPDGGSVTTDASEGVPQQV
jgi:hypothetical protein